MKHKIKVKVPIEKKGRNLPYSIGEMMLYDDLFYDD